MSKSLVWTFFNTTFPLLGHKCTLHSLCLTPTEPHTDGGLFVVSAITETRQ
jgi:hypothetical protein